MAIAHEWIDGQAGSEKTFAAMAEAFPDADLFALTAKPGVTLDLGQRPLNTTFLDRFASTRDRRGLTLPLMPFAWRHVKAPKYDIVLTSTHACVKGFRPGREAHHYAYCHSPMRYVWEPDIDRRGKALGPLFPLAQSAFRRWDRNSTRWVDEFAANSMAVRERIQRFYDRDAVVIPPPVDVDFHAGLPYARRDTTFALAASRWIPYKRLDLVIAACKHLDLPLIVAGGGPEEAKLQRLAQSADGLVRFAHDPTDDELRELYRTASVLVFPALEDFGIVPVEAQAAGTPVVALAAGGTLDTVIDGHTGILVEHQTVEAFANGITRALGADFQPEHCRASAMRFSRRAFIDRIMQWVNRGEV